MSNKTNDQVLNNPNLSYREQLERLQLEEYLEKRRKEQDEKEQFEAFRQAQIASVKQSMEERSRAQATCPHMKQNFRPNIGGQKDHKGNFHFLCQFCGKEFGNDIPIHLRISAEMVGGPQ